MRDLLESAAQLSVLSSKVALLNAYYNVYTRFVDFFYQLRLYIKFIIVETTVLVLFLTQQEQ